MTSTIKIKNSSTAGAVPGSGDLVQGELAVNVTDKKIYTKNASGTVVNLGTTPSITDNGNAEAIVIDSSENVGLGVSPSAWGGGKALELGTYSGNAVWARSQSEIHFTQGYYNNGTNFIRTYSGAIASYQVYAGNHAWLNAGSGTVGNTVAFTQAMTLDASGNLLLGTTSKLSPNSGAAEISIQNALSSELILNCTKTGGIKWDINSGSSGSAGGGFLSFYDLTSSATRMQIDSSGNLLVAGTTVGLGNGGFQVQPAGNGAGIPLVGVGAPSSSNSNLNMAVYSTNLGQYQFYVGMGGTVYARSTSITGLSDQREKENIRALDVGLNEILALQPRRFDWKNGSVSNVAGFVAQEVETVLPDLVEEYKINDDETRLGLKMGDMIPVLVKAIQEQQAIITQLQADVAALKGQA